MSRNFDIAVIAIASIAVGTLAAVATVPDDVQPQGALWLPGLCLSIGLTFPVLIRLRTDLRLVLRVENILMIGIVYWLLLDLVQGAYAFDDVTRQDVEKALLACGLFGAAVWVGLIGRGWRLPRVVTVVASRELSSRTLFRATLIAFSLGMAKFVIASDFNLSVAFEGLAASRWAAPWSRGQFGGADAFLDHLAYFGYLVPPLCVILAVRLGWTNWRVVVAIVLSVTMVMFLSQAGGRRVNGVVIGAAIFAYVVARPLLKAKIVVGVGVAVAATLYFLQEMLRYRNVGWRALLEGERPTLQFSHLHVDDNFLRLTQLIGFYPEQIEFVYWRPLFHAFTLPIPRIFWPGKPVSSGVDLPGLLGKEGVSLSSSIVGELYVSFGFIAIFVGGWLLGRFAGMWNRLLYLPNQASRALLFSAGLMAVFAGLRSLQALVQMSYVVLAWLAVSMMLRGRSSGQG